MLGGSAGGVRSRTVRATSSGNARRADKLLAVMRANGAAVLTQSQTRQLENLIFTEIRGPRQGGKINRELIGKNAGVILQKIGMNVPEDLRYTSDHEWARLEDGRVRIGITDYAQDALGDVVFVQLPAPGTKVEAGASFSEVESTKSVSDIYAPVTGEVVEVNDDLGDAPERLNDDPYGEGWICLIEPDDAGAYETLLDAAAYRQLITD